MHVLQNVGINFAVTVSLANITWPILINEKCSCLSLLCLTAVQKNCTYSPFLYSAGLILRKIKSSFSATLTKVRSALETQQTDPKDVREFLFTYFEGKCSIPDVTDMRKIFESITAAQLWKYEHYGPLEDLAENFLPDDTDPARIKLTEYVRQFSAFCTTTSIIDFVKANDFEDPDEDNQIFSPKKYNRSYRQITFILKLEDSTSISEMTLEDVHKLWILLKKKFHLPSLTAVIDKIVHGSLEITWLVLPHVVEKLRTTIHKSLDFFQQHNIIKIMLYDELVLYDEAWVSPQLVHT